MYLTSSGTISFREERIQISEAGRKQNEIVFKSLVQFSTLFRVKESSRFLLAI